MAFRGALPKRVAEVVTASLCKSAFSYRAALLCCLVVSIALGCETKGAETETPKAQAEAEATGDEEPKTPAVVDDDKPAPEPPTPKPAFVPTEPPPPELLQPVVLWRDGNPTAHVDAQGPEAGEYAFIDLGEGFSPILFTDGPGADGKHYAHSFRPTYLALARGEFPKDPYGERAQKDKYLELYGIMPTLGVLRKRLHWAQNLECAKHLDLTALASFTNGVVVYQGNEEALKTRSRYLIARNAVDRVMEAQGVTDPKAIDTEQLEDKDKAQLKYYLKNHDDYEAIKAAQERLLCEGYFKGKGKWKKGAFDWPTHEALAEFERRHRVYSWGFLGKDTLEALRMETAEVEHETVIRVLTERAMHGFGAVEDGSARKPDGSPVTYKGADGNEYPVPNLEAQLRKAVIKAFGLETVESTLSFLDRLGKLELDGHYFVAIPGPRRPEYHSPNMDLRVSIDRGDVWYEFPYDENGKEKPQPVSRRPRVTVYVKYLDQQIPIVSFGTTIGGWRTEMINDVVWWKYKGSEYGEVVWEEVVSAPIWLPPGTTPPRDLLKRRENRQPGESKWIPNYHETGPSYASAYGLVAAYHRPFARRADGSIRVAGDQGIRTHGSVDYMSIMRRHSHGCHRLHNHIAVRFFSFVINHRPHKRTGHAPASFRMNLNYDNENHVISIKQGGYVFRLDEPIFVMVEEGRIRGSVERPIATPIPRYHEECKGYYLPDGSAVTPQPNGVLVPVPNAKPCEPIMRSLEAAAEAQALKDAEAASKVPSAQAAPDGASGEETL